MKDSISYLANRYYQEEKARTRTSRTQSWEVTSLKIKCGENKKARRIAKECLDLTAEQKAQAIQTGCLFQEEGFEALYRSESIGERTYIYEVSEVFGDYKQGYVSEEIKTHLVVRAGIMSRTFAPAIPLEKITIIK